MPALRIVTTAFLLLLLNGCLQVELVGPVVGARVTVTPLRGGGAVLSGLITGGVAEARTNVGEEVWSSLKAQSRLLLLGGVQIPTQRLDNKAFYLVTAQDGIDMDFNGNGKLDVKGRELDRPLHAIMTGAQLKKSSRVNLLTEAIYQNLHQQIPDLTDSELRKLLNNRAARLVGDVNGDQKRNYRDVLNWSRTAGDHDYKGPEIFLKRMPRSIADSTHSSAVLKLDSSNLVMGARWQPARENTDYSEKLLPCATAVTKIETCIFEVFPLMGMERAIPSVDDVMARLVVSHPWMAERFEEVLHEAPADLMLLFRSVSGIVIDADTSVSYYRPRTSVIYLDGDYFWRTPQERKHITVVDYDEEEYTGPLEFDSLWRYVKNNEPAIPEFDKVDENGNRSLDDIIRLSAGVLFHELAHAADSYRPASFPRMWPWRIPAEVNLVTVSEELWTSNPLRSKLLFNIADVFFYGAELNPVFSIPVPVARFLPIPSDIGDLMDAEGASDLYSYTGPWEDTAMLFEESMMALHYGYERDIAFIALPEPGAENSCENLQVGWGMRGRIKKHQVYLRAKEVVANLLPERDYVKRLEALPDYVPMDINKDWCENLVLTTDNSIFIPSSKSRGPELAIKPPKRNPRRYQ